MRADILQTIAQGVRGGKQKVSTTGMTRLVVSKGFNDPQDSIYIDTFVGSGSSYEARETALINITWADGITWSGSFSDLRKDLTK